MIVASVTIELSYRNATYYLESRIMDSSTLFKSFPDNFQNNIAYQNL